MFDIEVAENLERLKKKYYYNMDIYDKLCALGFLLRRGIIPDELKVLYNNDIRIMEQNLMELV
ncbi:MAG: hypothetical protein ACM3KR_00795 [Deltaproteobacteria bacterium]